MDSTLTADEVRWRDELHQFHHNELWAAYDSAPPQRLYHYSKTENIKNIFKSKEMRLTDVRHMEDKEDGIYWLKVFRPIIKQRPRVPVRVKNVFARSDDFDLGQGWYLYAACYSAHDNLAHQWERFAECESGCAIEIDCNRLLKGAGASYGMLRLLYERTEQKRKAYRLVSEAVKRASRVPQADRDRYWVRCAALEFLKCGQRFKKSCCSEEDEWRLAIAATDSTNREYGNDGKPRTSLPLAPDLVTGVVKGRYCKTPDEAIQGWLEQSGYPGVVRQCPMPLL